MDTSQGNILLIVSGIVAIIIELLLGVATGFDLLLLGIILILSGGIGLLTGSFPVALLAIVILSGIYIVVGRRFVKQSLQIKTTKTNSDALIGKRAEVTKAIGRGHAGQVKIEGEIWRAISEKPMKVGQRGIIDAIDGVTLHITH